MDKNIILFFTSVALLVSGAGLIRHNLKKGVGYKFGRDLRRTFLTPRGGYVSLLSREECSLIIPGLILLLGFTLLFSALWRWARMGGFLSG